MNIVDFGKLKPGRQDPQTGFYIVAQCPECHAPIYWHGPGQTVEGEVGEIPLPSCLCMTEMPFEMAIPVKYEFEIERNSILHLFREYYGLLRASQDAGHTDTGTADGSGSSGDSSGEAQEEG